MFAGVAVLVVLPFTCARRDTGGTVTLRLWAGGMPEETAMFAEAVAAFEAAHPGVRVKLEAPGGGRLDKYLAAMQAGSCADVIWVHWRTLPALAAKEVLLPLDDLRRRDAYDLDDFYPDGLNAYTYDGRLCALPHKGSTMVLYYNRDLFDRYNRGVSDAEKLPYPNDDWTWDDFLEAARKLTKTDEMGRTVQVGCLPYDWSSWVWSAGGKFTTDDMTQVFFTNAETRSGLRFYADLRNRWRVTTRNMNTGGHDPAAVDVFEKGNVAMAVSGPWMLPKYVPIDSFRWDIALFPKGPAGRQTRYAGMALAVWKGSRHQDLAWELTKFLCGRQAGGIFAKGFLDLPARRSVARGAFARQPAAFDMDVLLRSMEPAHARIRVFPKSEKWPVVNRIFEEHFEAALIENVGLDRAMDDAQRDAERFLASTRAEPGPADYVGLAVLGLAVGAAALWGLRRSKQGTA